MRWNGAVPYRLDAIAMVVRIGVNVVAELPQKLKYKRRNNLVGSMSREQGPVCSIIVIFSL